MTPEKQQELFNRYPKIFRDSTKSPQETCMCWGCSCDDGWYWLLDRLCDCIQGYLDHNAKDIQLVADQVKEKYGTLRFYFHWEENEGVERNGDAKSKEEDWHMVEGMVWLAENQSAHICEKCGSFDGKLRTGGWWKTLCDSCQEKR